MTMDRENYNELIEMIDRVGPDDIAHFASYGGYNKDSLQHTREISELISAFGSSYVKEKCNFLHNVSQRSELVCLCSDRQTVKIKGRITCTHCHRPIKQQTCG